jgi:hypothetical protein
MKNLLLGLALFSSMSILANEDISGKYLYLSGPDECEDVLNITTDGKKISSFDFYPLPSEFELNQLEKRSKYSRGRMMDMGPGGSRTTHLTKVETVKQKGTLKIKYQSKQRVKPGNDILDYIINSLDDVHQTYYQSLVGELEFNLSAETLKISTLSFHTASTFNTSSSMLKYVELGDEGELRQEVKRVTLKSPIGIYTGVNMDVDSKICVYQKH